MSDGYGDGRRDADIKSLKEQMAQVWAELRESRDWQNRAIGYATAITTTLSLLIQYLFKKFGA